MNLQEHIRKVLREETQKVSPFILRRIDFNKVEKMLKDEIEEYRYFLSQIGHKTLRNYIINSDNVENRLDYIFRKLAGNILPLDVSHTYYDELQYLLKAQYYDYVLKKVKEYQLLYLKKNKKMYESILYEEVSELDRIVYHGTLDKHEFDRKGIMYDGTFFSTSENEAKGYGDYVYEVTLKKNLEFIDTNKLEDCELILNEFETLIDPYYYEDEDGYFVTEPEQLYNSSDSWSVIESNDDLMEWLKGNYDGVWIYEGGIRNLLLFSPINDKVESIKLK